MEKGAKRGGKRKRGLWKERRDIASLHYQIGAQTEKEENPEGRGKEQGDPRGRDVLPEGRTKTKKEPKECAGGERKSGKRKDFK